MSRSESRIRLTAKARKFSARSFVCIPSSYDCYPYQARITGSPTLMRELRNAEHAAREIAEGISEKLQAVAQDIQGHKDLAGDQRNGHAAQPEERSQNPRNRERDAGRDEIHHRQTLVAVRSRECDRTGIPERVEDDQQQQQVEEDGICRNLMDRPMPPDKGTNRDQC